MITFVLIILLSASLHSGQEFCKSRSKRESDARNAEWYPEECITKVQPLGKRCHLRCKEGYMLQEGALMFSDCIGEDQWSGLEFGVHCLPIISGCVTPKNPSSGVYCPNNQSVPVGKICTFEGCTGSGRVGPALVTCKLNGDWMGNGSYCKERLTTAMHCADRSLTVETDVHSSTVDVRRYLKLPTLQALNPSQMRLPQNTTLGVGKHVLKFESIGPDGEIVSCSVDIIVIDKEAPRVLSCIEEEERFTIPYYATVVNPSNCTFEDNVDGILNGTFIPPATGVELREGTHYSSYNAKDSNKNTKAQIVTYNVKGKECQPRAPITDNENNKIIKTPFFNNQYTEKCINDSYSRYTSYGYPFTTSLDILIYIMSTYKCDSNTFLLKNPLVGCFPISPIQNNSCPVGQVKDARMLCVPCPKSFFYNETSSACILCPPNTTTTTQGSTTCVACPNNSRTIRTRAPIICEYFCKPGEAYTSSGCQKCSLGEYVEPGGEVCMKCPQNMTTITNDATSSFDCIYGTVLNKKSEIVNLTGVPVNNRTYYIRFAQTISTNQLEQRVAIQFYSSHISQKTDCTKDYVQVIGFYGDTQNLLTDKLCGDAMGSLQVIKYRPWRINVIKYVTTDTSPFVDLEIAYAIGTDNCEAGMIFNLTSSQCQKCKVNTYQERFEAFQCRPCEQGTTNYGDGQTFCIAPCPDGFGSNGTTCLPCDMNFYEKNSTCLPCPNGMATEFIRSTQCSKSCDVGEFLHNKTDCMKCPLGTYQPLSRHAQSVCRYCPQGKTTIKTGSVANDDCIVKCRYEGEYYNTKSNSCEPCQVGTYKTAGPYTVANCTMCPSGMTTNETGSIWKTSCMLATKTPCEVNNTCVFPGQCVDNGTDSIRCVCPKYHTGKNCESVTGPCDQFSCENNGTCHPFSLSGNYTCLCKPGFQGKNCTIEHNPCQPNPCYKSNCTVVSGTSTKLDFNCTCPTYFTGKRCTIDESPCGKRSNCVHGTCHNDPLVHGMNNYTCTCNQGFRGLSCNIREYNCDKYPCEEKGTEKCKEEPGDARTCVCKAGYFGETCDQFKGENNCDKYPCEKKGTEKCKEEPGDARTCVCKAGYFGETCDQFKASVKCIAGQFHYNKTCCQCWHGSYNSEPGESSECTECPDGRSTLNRGATSSNACEETDKRERFDAEILLLDKDYQTDLVKTGCGEFALKFEELIKNLSESKGGVNVAVRVDKYLKPPTGKSGILVKFTVYGDNENNEKILRDAVQSGEIGDLKVERGELKIKERHSGDDGEKAEKKDRTWIYITIGVVVAVVLLLIISIRCYARSKRTEPRKSNFIHEIDGNAGNFTFKVSET